MKMMSRSDVALKCHRMWEEAEKYRQGMVGVFEHLSRYARPSVEMYAANGAAKGETPHTMLFDTTLLNSVEEHAAGIKAWMSPANSQWFKLLPHPAQRGNEMALRYWESVGQQLEEILNNTNFHAEDFEAVLDGAAFGTRGLLITPPSPYGTAAGKPFVAKRWNPTAFTMLEDSDGMVSSVFLNEKFTARQAVEKFGEAFLPEKVLGRWKTKPESTEQDEYVLCIYKRERGEYDPEKITPDSMPFSSNWIHKETKTLVLESGHMEMPVIASRHLKWSGTPFGLPPAIKALADARQLNGLQCSLDLLVDIAANPRLLVPIEMEGNINLEPGGVTYYGDPNRTAKEWGTQGRFQEGDVRVRMRRADIERALNLDVFKTFRRITKEISATEAMEIRNESIDLFSPVFSLMSTEHYERCLIRILTVCLNSGWLPPPPPELVEQGNRGPVLPDPKVQFTSRMAIALSNRHKAAIDETIQRRATVAQFIGEAAFDDIKLPEALRLVDRANGLPVDLHRSPEEVAEIQQARAQQQAMQHQLDMAEKAASAAGKIKGTPILNQVA